MGFDIEQLESYCTAMVHWKQEEDAAKKKRTEYEELISSALATKDEGTDKAEIGAYKVTVTSKLTRTLDYPAYLAICDGLPEGVRCVELKPSIDLKKLRALEMIDPSLPAHFISTKPAKAAVKIEVM